MHTKDPLRQLRSYRTCWLLAEEQARRAPPRESGAYVPELAAALDDDCNLTDGARHCARKVAEYSYRVNCGRRSAEITVTWLVRALGTSRRTIQLSSPCHIRAMRADLREGRDSRPSLRQLQRKQ